MRRIRNGEQSGVGAQAFGEPQAQAMLGVGVQRAHQHQHGAAGLREPAEGSVVGGVEGQLRDVTCEGSDELPAKVIKRAVCCQLKFRCPNLKIARN